MAPDTLLYRGLPAVNIGNNRFVVYSPYKKKVVECSFKDIEHDKLVDIDIFGEPVWQSWDPQNPELCLILTRDCNLRCLYCFAFGGEKTDKMSLDMIRCAIQRCVSSEAKSIRIEITGGEPTTYPEGIKEAVNCVRNSRIPTEFVIGTSGVIQPEILEYLIHNNFSFHVSMDGPPEVNDRLRPLPNGGGSSPYILHTIRRLVEKNAKFKVRATITPNSVERLCEFVKYFAALGVKYIHFESIDMWGKAGRGRLDRCPPEAFVNNFSKALDIAIKQNVKLIHDAFVNFTLPKWNACPCVGGKRLVFMPDGRITRCYDCMDPTHPLAEILTVGRLDIANKNIELNHNLERQLNHHSVEDIPDCKDCFVKYLCAGGCLNRRLYNTAEPQDLRQTDPDQCTETQGLMKEIIIRTWRQSKEKQFTD